MTIRNIRRQLRALGSREKARILQGFFKTGPGEYGEGDVFLGVRVPELRAVAGQCDDLAWSGVKQLLASPIHEERLLALLILVRRYERGGRDLKNTIYDLYLAGTDRINNWDLVDLSAHPIVGAHLAGKSKRPLYRLARSGNLWERRIAIVATYHGIKRGEFAETLKVAGMLLQDKEDLIHKAVGWMLREVGNRNRATEEDFLREHYRTMPRTMLRYAIEKFPERRRQAYLKGRA